MRIARDAIAAGACRIINIKPGRVGGHRESIRLHDLCAEHGIPVWHGGMLETGIGRAHNIHLASLPNFSLPGDIAASKRYYEPDLIDPPIEVAADGTIAVPDGPGIGVHHRGRIGSSAPPSARLLIDSTSLTDRMMRQPVFGRVCALVGVALLAGCASAPAAPPTPPRTVLTYEQKMAWILRLEEDRVLELPAPPAPPPAPVATTGRTSPVVVPRRRHSRRCSSLLKDDEARIRRRAALADRADARGRGRGAALRPCLPAIRIPRCARWPRSRSGCSARPAPPTRSSRR